VTAPSGTVESNLTFDGSLLYINGSGRFTSNLLVEGSLTASGNVGIGTTSPSEKLSISGNTNSYTALQISNGAAGGRSYGFASTDNTNGNGGGKFGIFDFTASAYRMTIDNTGNVGIGLTSPGAKLDIDATSGDTLRLSRDTSNSPSAADWIRWDSVWGPNSGGIRAGDTWAWDTQLYGTQGLSFRGATYSSASPHMIINTNGYVGIGTTIPETYLGSSAKLAVNGVLNVGTNTNIGSFLLGGSSVLSTTNSPNTLTINAAGFSNVVIPAGNVGIGTTSPGAQLQVSSSAAGTIGSIIKGAASQSADLLQAQNSSSSVLAQITSNGTIKSSVGVYVGNDQLSSVLQNQIFS